MQQTDTKPLPPDVNGRSRKGFLWLAMCSICLILVIVIGMTIKNNTEQQRILAESICSRLLAVAYHAREMIDPIKFDGYNSVEDTIADRGAYGRTITNLRMLGAELEVEYIYALKEVDGEYVFVFDTDLEDPEIFVPYTLSAVHAAAFAGEAMAGVMNVKDEYGTFNTAAAPIWKDGKVIGIIAVDIKDKHYTESSQAALRNLILLIAVLVIAMGVVLIAVLRMSRRVREMQERLRMMAHYDPVTGLPNRQYLLGFLDSLTRGAKTEPFALFFIDLDNFKSVNDGAGHEAGDELLRQIANHLSTALLGGKAFRPSPGRLNIAARIGGDEFIELVTGITTPEEAGAAAQTLIDGLASIDSRYIKKYNVGLSIGVALYPYHSQAYHVLIQYADSAMYHAKRAGKNQYRIYEDEMHRTQ